MKTLTCDPAKIARISEPVVSHQENNYGGAVRHPNLIDNQLAELDYAKAAGFLFNGLKKAGRLTVESLVGGMIPTLAACCCAGIALYLVGTV
jgi:Fe-Mn family superoxide dismutase